MTFATPAYVHPHVFAEARLDITIKPDGTVEKLGHVWRFDDLFSSTVLVEFDKNGDLKLDDKELADLASTINKSISEFDYFQTVQLDGKTIVMAAPDASDRRFPEQSIADHLRKQAETAAQARQEDKFRRL